MTSSQNVPDTLVEKWTTSLHSSRGVEPVTSCQVAFSVDPVTEQSSRMLAELAFPGRQGSGIETKIGCKWEEVFHLSFLTETLTHLMKLSFPWFNSNHPADLGAKNK